ncbi:MAG: 3-oxoacyl-[acyl-carrier protein] reductase, partial [uncultured Rubrobacteraceae bacterium]
GARHRREQGHRPRDSAATRRARHDRPRRGPRLGPGRGRRARASRRGHRRALRAPRRHRPWFDGRGGAEHRRGVRPARRPGEQRRHPGGRRLGNGAPARHRVHGGPRAGRLRGQRPRRGRRYPRHAPPAAPFALGPHREHVQRARVAGGPVGPRRRRRVGSLAAHRGVPGSARLQLLQGRAERHPADVRWRAWRRGHPGQRRRPRLHGHRPQRPQGRTHGRAGRHRAGEGGDAGRRRTYGQVPLPVRRGSLV